MYTKKRTERFLASLVSERYSDGAYVARQGEPGEAFYIVAEGRVRVMRAEELSAECTSGAADESHASWAAALRDSVRGVERE